MLMMLACLAHWRRGVAADAHDAGLSGWLGKNGERLMLMMLACLAHWRRGVAADAHDACLVRLARENGERLMLMMLEAGVLESLEMGFCG